MYELISNLRPYFFSLREIEKNVSLDIKIPSTWRLEHVQQVLNQYKSMAYKVQDKNDKFQLLSLISSATQEGYDTARLCALEIINHNLEMEQKQMLFKQKVKQLEELFQKESLDKLKEINFLEENEQEDSTGIRMAEQRDEQGPEGDSGTQEEDD